MDGERPIFFGGTKKARGLTIFVLYTSGGAAGEARTRRVDSIRRAHPLRLGLGGVLYPPSTGAIVRERVLRAFLLQPRLREVRLRTHPCRLYGEIAVCFRAAVVAVTVAAART